MIYSSDNACVYRDGVAILTIGQPAEAERIVRLANIALTQEPDYSRIVQDSMYQGQPNHVLAQNVIAAFKEFQSRSQ